MQKFVKKMVLIVGGVLAVDSLIPGVGWSELILQTVLVTTCAALMYFRQ
jgi:hypothetical protein